MHKACMLYQRHLKYFAVESRRELDLGCDRTGHTLDMAASQSGVFVAGALEQSQAAWDWVLPAIRSSKTRGPNFGEPCGQFKVWSKTVIQFCHFVLSRTCNYISLMMMMMMMMMLGGGGDDDCPSTRPSIHSSMNHSINQLIDQWIKNSKLFATVITSSNITTIIDHGVMVMITIIITICHHAIVGFWKKASADSFDIVGVGRHIENDIWIYYTLGPPVWGCRPCFCFQDRNPGKSQNPRQK